MCSNNSIFYGMYTIMCDFLKFSFADSSISCLSREFEGDILADAVVVRIDKAVINQTGVEFEYKEDPDFTAVTPKTVIPG